MTRDYNRNGLRPGEPRQGTPQPHKSLFIEQAKEATPKPKVDRIPILRPNTKHLADDETILEPAEARPCPFCGVQPTIQPWHGGAPTKVMIHCADECDEIDECPVRPGVTGETRAEALDKWNHRT